MSEIAVSRPSHSVAVAVVTVDRPARRNALNLQAWRDLAAAFRSLAAIAGSCVGGGCAIALCCDFRVMHSDARFGIPATRLGTIYTIEECRFLFSVVGLANAKRILYGSELFDAASAQVMGFADAVVDGDVVESAIAFGASMSANAPLAIAGTKRILQALASGDVEAQR